MTAQAHRVTRLAGRNLQPETLMLGYGYDPEMSEGSVKTPLFLTSTFVFQSADQGRRLFDHASGRAPMAEGRDAGLVYTRINNPNLQIVEERLAVLEKAEEAAVFASGMAAISTTLLAHVKPGDTLVRSGPLYGGTEKLIDAVLGPLGIHSTSFHDGLDEAAIRAAFDTATGPVGAVFVETPANPTNAVTDIALVRRIADAHAAKQGGRRPLLIVDNTYLGPIFQSPLAHGADIVVYSLTKYVGGHSDLVAGGAMGRAELMGPIKTLRVALGCQLDVHSSWMLTRSLETLRLRMERAFDNALTVARWLAEQPGVLRVTHPALLPADAPARLAMERQGGAHSATFSFEVEGGRERAFALLDHMAVIRLAVSLGGTESLACHPATTTHSGVGENERIALGVTEGLIRLSIGVEGVVDLITDLEQALKARP